MGTPVLETIFPCTIRRPADWGIPTRSVSEGQLLSSITYVGPSLTYRVMIGRFHIASSKCI